MADEDDVDGQLHDAVAHVAKQLTRDEASFRARLPEDGDRFKFRVDECILLREGIERADTRLRDRASLLTALRKQYELMPRSAAPFDAYPAMRAVIQQTEAQREDDRSRLRARLRECEATRRRIEQDEQQLDGFAQLRSTLNAACAVRLSSEQIERLKLLTQELEKIRLLLLALRRESVSGSAFARVDGVLSPDARARTLRQLSGELMYTQRLLDEYEKVKPLLDAASSLKSLLDEHLERNEAEPGLTALFGLSRSVPNGERVGQGPATEAPHPRPSTP